MIMKNESTHFTCAFASILLVTTNLYVLFEYRLINAMIITHVLLGFLAFFVGTVTFFSKKGGKLHSISGRIFYISMTISVSMSLVVSVTPFYFSPSLFQIGILSLYFLIGGRRSLSFKAADHNIIFDKIIALVLVIISISVMLYSVFTSGDFYPLRVIFGTVGIGFASIDLWLFRSEKYTKRNWLALHLSKMIGGYTAAVTAFFVAQKLLGGYYDWFVPTVLSLILVLYWLVKMNAIRPSLNTSTDKTLPIQ